MLLESALIMSLASDCQSNIDVDIIQRLINIESSGNPYAIAVKGIPIVKQPTSKEEAILSARQLESLGLNFSVGLMQINHTNFKKTGLKIETAFNYCENIKAGSQIFKECLDRAKLDSKDDVTALNKAASCYYSGNFTYGFKKEGDRNISYVDKFNGVDAGDKKPTSTKPEPKREYAEQKERAEVWDVFKDFS